MMIVKKHEADERVVLAICDSDLLGKKVENDDCQLDLTSDFYKGEEKTKEEIVNLLDTANVLNVVGKESVGLLKELEIISDEGVKEIDGVPFAMVVLR